MFECAFTPPPLPLRPQSHASDLGVLRTQLREAQESVAQLRLAASSVQREGEAQVQEVSLGGLALWGFGGRGLRRGRGRGVLLH